MFSPARVSGPAGVALIARQTISVATLSPTTTPTIDLPDYLESNRCEPRERFTLL